MYKIGVDVGGTNIKIGVFDAENKLLDKFQIKTDINSSNYSLFKDVSIAIKNYAQMKKIKLSQIKGVGFGIPGAIKDNYAAFCPNIGLKNLNVKESFLNIFKQPCKVVSANDANLAAYGEYMIHNKNVNCCVFITIGTGVGGGIIYNGKIIEGFSGAAGEIGHINVTNPYNFSCNCGLHNCVETLSSATGIIRLATLGLKDYPNSILHNISFKTKEIIEGAVLKDELCLKVIDESMLYLAKAMCNISLILNPELFIIGGGVSNAGDIIINNLKRHFYNICHPDLKKTNIILSSLKNDAGIYGACYLLDTNSED